MPQKSSKARGAAAHGPAGPTPVPVPGPHPKAVDPNPSPAAATVTAVAVAVDAMERLHVSSAASDGDPPEKPPPPEPEAPPPPPPPAEASSSGRAAVGRSWEEEAVMKLHELAGVAGEDVELTEEELRANDQRQEDEICALEAIFGDAVVIFNKKGGQRSFQIHVHIEIPDAIDVSTKLSYGDGILRYGGACDGDEDDLVYKFRVEHLPPILLTCLLPSSYPSHHPPLFTVSTEWLDKGMISSLCRMLDYIWEEQHGMEVTYQWVQWLQSSSLSHLGFDNEIVLSKGNVTCSEDGGDERACSDNASPDAIIPRMMRYNDNRHHEAFLNAIHNCMICFSELPGSSFTLVVSAITFVVLFLILFFVLLTIKVSISSNFHVIISFAGNACNRGVPPNILKRLLGENEFERWEGLLLQRTLDAMSDVVYCPRCQTACLEDADHEAVCSNCLFSFCTLCRSRRHIGEQCLSTEERLLILEARQKAGQMQGDQQKILNELKSLKEIMKDSKLCPKCKMAISKTEGCNKMVCLNCNEYFCYQCNRAITGYDHFKGSCVLFPQEEIDRWELQMNPRVRRQDVAQAHADIMHSMVKVIFVLHAVNHLQRDLLYSFIGEDFVFPQLTAHLPKAPADAPCRELWEKKNSSERELLLSTRVPLYGRATRRGGVLARIPRDPARERQMESTRGEREHAPEEAESKEVRMLREMMLQDSRQGEESQVSDEQLRSNDQRQQDEVLAMEAIYGDNVCNFSEKAGLRSFQIYVHCEVPDGISVIYFLTPSGIDFIKLPCGHYFCWRCMETYSRMHVKDGTVLKLLCPDAKCQGGVPPNLLKRFLGDADFERWERLILQKTLDSMADVSYCPRCETACLEDEENNTQCSKCFFSFCTRCRDRRHIGKKCVFLTPEEKLLSSWEREKLHRLSKGDSDKTVYLAKEMLSIKEVLRSSVPCPHCGTAISRVSGCNHMICRRCGKAFCYGCGDLGCSGCGKNRSTDPTQLDVISFLGEETQKETHKQPTLQESSRQHPCPNCHQPNPKVMYHSFQMSHELVMLLLL
ncbi:hypothetical protein PR202_ga19174 [Eleusine coracana subsp. coracana]|uniref:RBR-type E3 ubiquitin transferase n=1 Tax=Eleusine coracana subsp. coracana TaxID=191504 RepID=A0AAV5CVE0_ELECO|nr:hypothetical protein PR202_ga19174 [Eleusine coracana subsp. coracana]